MTQQLLSQTRRALELLCRALPKVEDRTEVLRWFGQLNAIERDAEQPLDAAVALLGESGAGKSSLINAVLGCDLLPHDAGSAVTAAVTEIAAGDDGFEITVQTETSQSFHQRFASACGRLREVFAADQSSAPVTADESDASLVRSVTGMEIDELLKHSKSGQESRLLLPEVQDALARGPNLRCTFADAELPAVQSRCRDYLSSKKSLWPLVQRVSIRGPFQLLRSGIRLVDVPGLNDPDPVRNRVAQDALRSAHVVWLVLSAKRAMTGAVMSYLTESGLLYRLEMNDRLGSLVVVATHADQLDDRGLIQAFSLPEDTSLDDLLTRHKERVQTEVRTALLRAWNETVNAADGHVNPETVESGRRRLNEVPFFSVSSTESLYLRRVMKSRKAPSLENDEQTGIPGLVRWMAEEFVAKERQAHQSRLSRRLQLLREAIRSTLSPREDISRKLAKLGSTEKGGLKGSQDRAQTFLDERLSEHNRRAEREVEAQAERLRVAIRAGVDAAESEITSHIPERLGGIHWATLRAIVRRDGVFNGSTRTWDLPAEVASSISKRVVFRWAELFETSAKQFLESVTLKSSDLLSQHAHFLYGLITEAVGDGLPAMDRLKRPTQRLEFELDLIRTEITERLESARMSFERDLVSNLRCHLRPAFERAANQSGRGMKQEMVKVIVHQLDQIAPELLPALTRDLNEKVVEVNGILNSQVERAHELVQQSAKIEAHNLKVAIFERTPEELIASADTIAEGLRLLEVA